MTRGANALPASNVLAWKPDRRAEKILLDTYWSSQGWKLQRTTAAEDFAYAEEAGYMFDPIRIGHAEIIERLLRLRSQIDPHAVARAFSDSFTTRRLDLRSALGSYGAIRHLPDHPLTNVHGLASGNVGCSICGHYFGRDAEDITVLNFERFKWGGVRHSQPLYALFDLSQFVATCPERSHGTNDRLLKILDMAANAPADCRPNGLVKLIAPFMPGNDAQRRVMIGCLGYAGILQPASHDGFFHGYPIDREQPPDGKNDWPYPVSWWRGRDGVNHVALKFYFPDI